AAALASSVSATPIDAGAEWCTVFCEIDSQCNCNERVCVSFSDLRARFNHNVLWHGRPSLCAGNQSWSLSRSMFWFLNNFYCHLSD
ncbi:hypothetical protein P692DRAFT_20751049, partial [Suillus brevipes Sb2]